ncbi:MAG: HTTM domain-containing protein, partial [Chloroflexota bacterium]|nr:HTTM domain-containing protein [Chloroflexota bacterium]
RSDTAPTWALVLLVAQMSIVYIYGGFAKLNGDWLRGEPMRTWLADESDLLVVGRWVTDEWFVYFVSYSGLLLDLLIVSALLWPKTRWFAVIALVLFHRFNAALFSIGIFPMFATAAIVLFLPPDLPRRVATSVQSMFTPQHRRSATARKSKRVSASSPEVPPIVTLNRRSALQRVGIACIAAYVAIQLLLPLRYFLYPGNPAWTDQGDRFAWRMMLHSKVGDVTYEITDPQTGTTWDVDPGTYLTGFQVGKLQGQPDMILQFSHFLAEEWRKDGYDDVEVRAQTMISLNGRDPQPIVDPTVNLAAEEQTIANASWITSLDEQERLAAAQSGQDGSQNEQKEEDQQQLQN